MAVEKTQAELDFEEVLRTPAGRRFVYGILQATNVFGSGFATDSRLAYAEGRRSVGAELLDKMQETDPLIFAKMIQEAMQALQKRQAEEALLSSEEVID